MEQLHKLVARIAASAQVLAKSRSKYFARSGALDEQALGVFVAKLSDTAYDALRMVGISSAIGAADSDPVRERVYASAFRSGAAATSSRQPGIRTYPIAANQLAAAQPRADGDADRLPFGHVHGPAHAVFAADSLPADQSRARCVPDRAFQPVIYQSHDRSQHQVRICIAAAIR